MVSRYNTGLSSPNCAVSLQLDAQNGQYEENARDSSIEYKTRQY